METTTINKSPRGMSSEWGWLLAGGILITLSGIFAITWPVSATVGIFLILATALFVSGAVGLFLAFRQRHFEGSAGRFVQSSAAIIAGVLMIRYPGMGMVGIAIALASFMFVSAVAKFMFAAALRPEHGAGWIRVSGAASFILGLMVLAMLPSSAVFIPGLLLGIDLVFYGSGLSAFAFRVRQAGRAIDHVEEEFRKVG